MTIPLNLAKQASTVIQDQELTGIARSVWESLPRSLRFFFSVLSDTKMFHKSVIYGKVGRWETRSNSSGLHILPKSNNGCLHAGEGKNLVANYMPYQPQSGAKGLEEAQIVAGFLSSLDHEDPGVHMSEKRASSCRSSHTHQPRGNEGKQADLSFSQTPQRLGLLPKVMWALEESSPQIILPGNASQFLPGVCPLVDSRPNK